MYFGEIYLEMMTKFRVRERMERIKLLHIDLNYD